MKFQLLILIGMLMAANGKKAKVLSGWNKGNL